MKNSYYYVKPLIPRALQISVRRKLVLMKRCSCRDIWPIDEGARALPPGWSGWPDKKRFALVLTHDVETRRGQEKCLPMIDIEEKLGFRSSVNFVPEGYEVSCVLRNQLTQRGCEVGIHGLTHRGNLFRSRRAFERQADRINHYLREWKSVGFRAPAMYHNLDWIHDLEIQYDASTFDTDPFEPQPDGVGTIFPFWVSRGDGSGYVELPYTLPQDFTLFILMQEKSIDIWKEKLDWIAEHGGMALLLTHPDYMNVENKRLNHDEYPAEYYKEFLNYIKSKYKEQYWHVLPKEIAHFRSEQFSKRV